MIFTDLDGCLMNFLGGIRQILPIPYRVDRENLTEYLSRKEKAVFEEKVSDPKFYIAFVKPYDYAEDLVNMLREYDRVVAITSRPESLRMVTIYQCCYGLQFRPDEILFSKDKAETIAMMEGDHILIEDFPSQFKVAAHFVDRVVVPKDYYNEGHKHPKVTYWKRGDMDEMKEILDVETRTIPAVSREALFAE